MRTTSHAFLVLLTLGIASPSLTRASDISFNTALLTIGMSQDAAVVALSRDHTLTSVPGPLELSSWLVTLKTRTPPQPAGSIAFRSGRLVSAYKYWGAETSSGALTLARTFRSALAQLQARAQTPCTAYTTDSSGPEFRQERAVVACGGRRLQITILRTGPGGTEREQVSIDEVIGEE